MGEKKEKRYVSDNAQLMSEWNWEKNSKLGFYPQKLTSGSGRKVWWRCDKGHEWQAIIGDRSNGTKCPYCAGKKILKGYNDLQTLNPILAKEWNYEKNGNLKPENFAECSSKKVWWKCCKGHEWQATIDHRNRGRGCPYCAGKKVLSGYNDLQTINPILTKEWNYEKNGDLKPANFTANSTKKIWWKCPRGHEWQTTINNRNSGNNCPYCAGLYPIKGYNDLQTVNPVLAKEWNYQKNSGLTPMDITPNSNKSVWWKCTKGHEWQAIVANRTKGRGCPVCHSERHTSFPEYALVYYIQKYGLNVIHSYKAQGYELDIYVPSKKIAIEYDGYFWHKDKAKKDLEKNQKCKKDGIQLYRIRDGLLSLNDTSIDYVFQGPQKDLSQLFENLLHTIFKVNFDIDLERDYIEIEKLREFTEKEKSISQSNPKIAIEWNFEKNGSLKPSFFSSSSHKKVWWKCGKGHEWQASIADRNRGRNCPYCSNRRILKGYNDLQAINPTLAKEWNYEKNNGLTPMDVTSNSNKKAWWKCANGHEWQAKISNRNNGNGCPECAKQKRKRQNK